MTDLSQLDVAAAAEDGVPMHVEGPNGEPLYQADGDTPITITLRGADSEALRNLYRRQANRYLQAHGRKPLSAEQAEKNQLEVLAAATVSWEGVKVDGEMLPCTKDNTRALYERFPFIKEQAQRFVDDRGNFSTASLKS